MPLLSKIKNALRRRPAQSPAGDRNETPASGGSAAPAGEDRSESTGLRNAIARGVAEGAAREAARKLFEGFFGD